MIHSIIFDYTFIVYTLCVYMFRICTLYLHVQCEFYSHHVQYGKTALHHAAEGGHTGVVKYLLENTTAEVNTKDRVSF